MKIIIRPILNPQREVDMTHQLVSAIAEELWRLFGGNDTLNWIEAEWHLQRIIASARAEARETAVMRVVPSVPNGAMNQRVQPVRRRHRDARLSRSPHTGDRRSSDAHSVEGTKSWKADNPQSPDAAMAHA
jgi:hypothetical protein